MLTFSLLKVSHYTVILHFDNYAKIIYNLHQSNGNVMKEVIEPGAVEHGVVPKVVLQPARLSLCGAHTHGRDDPSGP